MLMGRHRSIVATTLLALISLTAAALPGQAKRAGNGLIVSEVLNLLPQKVDVLALLECLFHVALGDFLSCSDLLERCFAEISWRDVLQSYLAETFWRDLLQKCLADYLAITLSP